MPTYEYECLKCGHTFEEFREINAPPRARCPSCRGRVRRLVSAGAGIVFRGSGWYAKDSRRVAGKPAAPSGAGESGTAAEPAASGSAEAVKPAVAEPAGACPPRRPGGKGEPSSA